MGMLHGQFEIVDEPQVAANSPTPAGGETGSPRPSGAGIEQPSAPKDQRARADENGVPPAAYTIVAGDTFSKIAMRFYGDATKWRSIAKANPSFEAKKLKIGQVISLPNPAETGKMQKAH